MVNYILGVIFLKKAETNNLLHALRSTHKVDHYLKINKSYLLDTDLATELNRIIDEKGRTKADVLRSAEINEIYGYQILSGKRMPSRDKLLCLGLSLQCSEEEMQFLLKLAQIAPLYPKRTRDSIILFGLLHQQTVPEVNEELLAHHEDLISEHVPRPVNNAQE